MNSMPTLSSCFLRLAVAVPVVLCGVSCSRAPARDESPDPVVKGEQIVFPEHSPQRAAIVAVAVELHAAQRRRLAGRLVWDESATVRVYAPVAGRVAAVDAALGDRVAADTPLARLASPDFGQAQTDARKAGADLMLAGRNFARAKDLFEHGAIARKDLEAAEGAHAVAESERQRAVARLRLYGAVDGEVDGLFTLRTPIAGTVVEKNLNFGQEVRPDQQLANAPQLVAPLFLISDPTRLRILIDASERDLPALRPGLAIAVRSAALADATFAGEIDGISDALDPTTHMVTVRGRVENPDRRLKAEMFVTVEFETKGAAGVAVPAKAVFIKGDRHFLYVEAQPGAYLHREVELGAEHEGKIVVRSGVQPGERVVIEGALLLDEIRAHPGGS